MAKVVGGPAVAVIENETEAEKLAKAGKARFNEDKGVYLQELTKPNAWFYDRDTAAEKSFSGKVIRPPIPGKKFEAVILEEWDHTNAKNYSIKHARLSVNFGRHEGWKEVKAIQSDNGQLKAQGKPCYERMKE